jgi:probable F420-dependent oxidoreductase
MGIGLKMSRNAPIESYRRVWQVADEAGFDHCWAFDHLVTVDADGTDRSVFEGWTLLGAMAVATRRTRIGLLVTGMVLRHPALLAKAAVTVDHLSGGRLQLGIGAGWAQLEHEMYGIDVRQPVGRLAEGLQVMELLWTEERADFEGRHYRLRDAVANPKPVQRPRPPLWIGAGGPTTLRIAAEHADVWNPAGNSLDEALAAGRQLVEACHVIGRDPSEIRWSAQFGFDGTGVGELLEEMRQRQAAGFTELVITCSGADPVRAAEAAAEQVLPAARQLG